MDIRESTQLTKERKPLKMAEILKSSKKQFIRTMQKDIESLQKVRSAKPSMPKADQVKKAVPPTELPVIEPSKRPASPLFPPLRLRSTERLKKEAEIKKRIEETQKRLEEERMKAEMVRQKTEREKVKEGRKEAEEAKPVSPELPTIPKPILPKPIPPKPVSLEKELPLKKEVKPAIKRTRLKFVLIGIGTIVVIAGIGGFLYWWNYLRVIPPVAMHYQCQDLQCVSIEEEGEDQCLTDEDCQPVEPTVPEPLIPVDETRTIELTIGQENLLLDDLKLVAAQEQTLNTFKRILAKLVSQTEKKYADLDILVSALGISLPDNILSVIAPSEVAAGNYILFLYNQTEGNHLGIVIEMGESPSLVEDLKTWEETIIADLKPILLRDEAPEAFTEDFQDNLYQDIAIRYLNFPMPDLSIDYAIVAGKLVITTSRESMYATIDALLAAEETEEIDTSNWQTYRNEEYGFEVQYPKNLSLEERSFVQPSIARYLIFEQIGFHQMINVYSKNQGQSIVEWYEENIKDGKDVSGGPEFQNPVSNESYLSITIRGMNALKIQRTVVIDERRGIFFEKDNIIIGFGTAYLAGDFARYYDRILSTFKFIEQREENIVNCGEIGPDNLDLTETVVNCVEQRFKECKPTQYTITLGLGPLGEEVIYYYEIIGLSNDLCTIKSKFLKNPNPDWIEKEMICEYDHKEIVDFETAVQNTTNCRGPLYDLMIGSD